MKKLTLQERSLKAANQQYKKEKTLEDQIQQTKIKEIHLAFQKIGINCVEIKQQTGNFYFTETPHPYSSNVPIDNSDALHFRYDYWDQSGFTHLSIDVSKRCPQCGLEQSDTTIRPHDLIGLGKALTLLQAMHCNNCDRNRQEQLEKQKPWYKKSWYKKIFRIR